MTFLRLLSKTMKNFKVGFMVNSLNRIGDEVNVKLSLISSI